MNSTLFHSLIAPHKSAPVNQPALTTGVGNPCCAASDADDELELHIEHCTHLMELAYERWERDGNFWDRGEADRWRMLRDEAARSRSPAQVARMEAERNLA